MRRPIKSVVGTKLPLGNLPGLVQSPRQSSSTYVLKSDFARM